MNSNDLKQNKELQTSLTASNSKVPTSDDRLLINEPAKKIDMEDVLDVLDNNLDKVLTQMESIKNTKDQLFFHTKKLQQNIEIYEEEYDLDEERAKWLGKMTMEIKKRENIMKEMEKREMLLSHSMLSIINNWADKLESNLQSHKEGTRGSPEITENEHY